MDINSESARNNYVNLVDYHNNSSLSKYGISFHWWNSETTSMHYHNFYEIFIITEGCALHEINGERFELPKGTLHLIRPEDMHRIAATPQRGCMHMNICLTEEKLRSICSALGIALSELTGISPLKTTLSVDETEFFTKRAERIGLLSYNRAGGSHVIMCELVTEALAILYKSRVFSNLNCPVWFTEVLEKIHSPEFLNCSASDVYALGGFCAPAMIEYFKEYTGKTVSEYLRGMKMKRACEVLHDTDMPIIELSSLLGYESLSHFNRIFKEHTGVTPAAYRKGRRA